MSHGKNRKDSLNDFMLLPFFNLAELLLEGQMGIASRSFCNPEKKNAGYQCEKQPNKYCGSSYSSFLIDSVLILGTFIIGWSHSGVLFLKVCP